jgi:hypothetical protein
MPTHRCGGFVILLGVDRLEHAGDVGDFAARSEYGALDLRGLDCGENQDAKIEAVVANVRSRNHRGSARRRGCACTVLLYRIPNCTDLRDRERASMNSQKSPVDDPAQAKIAAEIEKLQAETRLLKQPWRDPRGVLIPMLAALVGLGSWWQAHVTNKETEVEAKQVADDRDQLRVKVQELQAIADQQRTQLASAGAETGSVAAKVQDIDAIRRKLRAIDERSDRRVIDHRDRPPSADDAAPAGGTPVATVYVQVATDEQRREWVQRGQFAKELGYLVPGIEVVGSRAPSRTEVRYFRDTDEERRLAEQLVASLKDRTNTDATAKFVPGFEGRTKPKTLELWVAP